MDRENNQYLLHLWDGRHVNWEPGMFAGSDTVKLMFPAEQLISVTDHTTGTVFEAGKDYTHVSGSAEIKLLPGSRIPSFTEADLHPVESEKLRLHPLPDANGIRNAVRISVQRYGRIEVRLRFHSVWPDVVYVLVHCLFLSYRFLFLPAPKLTQPLGDA